MSTVIRRCYATLGGLSKSARGLPREVKKLIVEMLIFPHIRYCLSVWSGCGVVQRHRVQKIINHCAQVVMGVRRSAHVSPLLEKLEWPQIDRLVDESDCGNVHYLINNAHAPKCLSALFEHRSDVSSRKTRATADGQLELPRVRTEHARKFFTYRACALWNTLPADVRGSRTSSQLTSEDRERHPCAVSAAGSWPMSNSVIHHRLSFLLYLDACFCRTFYITMPLFIFIFIYIRGHFRCVLMCILYTMLF